MATSPTLLFVNQHYWPDMAATGQHLTDLAEYLAGAGFRVRVLCGRSGYHDGERPEALEREVRRGVDIHRVATLNFRRTADGQVGRTAGYLAFHVNAGRRLATTSRPDLVVSLTTPSLLPFSVRAVCTSRRVRYGIWAMDLHPDVEDRLGLLPLGLPVARALHASSRAAYRGADFVVALGPHMAERVLARGVEAERVREISVWSRADEIWPVRPADNPLRCELGYGPDDFVVMYSGNTGLAHRFEEVLAGMECLRDHTDIHFLFVGNGPRRVELECEAAARRLPRFRYRDYFRRDQLALSLSVGDIHLLTMRDDMAGLVAPSKLYGIMAAGRPTLMVGPAASEPGLVIRDAGVGEVLSPTTDPELGGRKLAHEILRLQQSVDLRHAVGERAREVFLRRFEKDGVCRRWEALLRERVCI